jgi:hypothetical protein
LRCTTTFHSLPRPSETREPAAAEAAQFPARKKEKPASEAGAGFSASPEYKKPPELLDPGAAALDQKNKHGDKQYAGNNPDNRDTVHNKLLFL